MRCLLVSLTALNLLGLVLGCSNTKNACDCGSAPTTSCTPCATPATPAPPVAVPTDSKTPRTLETEQIPDMPPPQKTISPIAPF